MNVVFLHPDLGIGGAERLVVDAALALKSKGHLVRFVTNHHDRSHCFPETRDGTVGVTVVGEWFPRSVLGKCQALCAYLRMMLAAFYLVWFSGIKCDVIFVDQISVCIPILRMGTRAKIVFYCHFPDQLLSAGRENLIKSLYRAPLDFLEEVTTGMAHRILVNSQFTAALEALVPGEWDHLKLVIAGGYDSRVEENVSHYKELVELSKKLGIEDKMLFLQSPSELTKIALIRTCTALIYTPENEHFGIVPLEAMYLGAPVVAMDSGGPKETVVDGVTGFLTPPGDAGAVAKAMSGLLTNNDHHRMGAMGREWVKDKFSFKNFSDALNSLVATDE
ncbi:unnamed protein product [Notodromas monacha]|uniref:Alpha-1,3/1,6-mannosyltransferase ALG2 n=1 Tax=Notodromas monacha TaxID=399045 RepID=A0A7R9GAC6_9CRUS|nr:unnamed protein product [Notodromas monacha]CAG0913552.1 unnamed protein product [Notodromas monacha]